MGGNRRGLQEIMEAYPAQPRFLLPILQDIQHDYKHLSAESMSRVAEYLRVPDSKVYAVATFYKALSLAPRGETEIKICMGTACHLRGAGGVLSEFEERLGIKSGNTTSDGRYSIERVNCLGACAHAPVVMVNEELEVSLSPTKVRDVLERMERP